MDVLLISFSICFLGVMVTVLIFSIAMHTRDRDQEPEATKKLSAPPEGFFMEGRLDPATGSGGPGNSLLLGLEQHVRMEHEAARAFLQGPTLDSLHAPSDSPLWN